MQAYYLRVSGMHINFGYKFVWVSFVNNLIGILQRMGEG